eukprot:gene4767-316_t
MGSVEERLIWSKQPQPWPPAQWNCPERHRRLQAISATRSKERQRLQRGRVRSLRTCAKFTSECSPKETLDTLTQNFVPYFILIYHLIIIAPVVLRPSPDASVYGRLDEDADRWLSSYRFLDTYGPRRGP